MTDPVAVVRQNWRILLLTVMLLAAAYFLFVPGAPIAGTAANSGSAGEDSDLAVDIPGNETSATQTTTGMTNLQYGIQLGGGARITAPPEGLVVDDISVTVRDPELDPEDERAQSEENAAAIEEAVVAAMTNVSDINVRVYHEYDTYYPQSNGPADVVEVRAPGDPEELAAGLRNAGYDVTAADVRRGVTSATRDEIIEVLDERLGAAGFSGGSVTESNTGQIIVEAPGRDVEYLEGLIQERGLVETIIHYPAPNGSGYERETLLRQDDFESIGGVSTNQQSQPYVPVSLREDAAQRYVDRMQATGFAQAAADRGDLGICNTVEGEPDGDNEYCLMTVVDGEVVWTGGMRSDLGESLLDETFLEDPRYQITTSDQGDASELRLNLIAGALPTELNLDRSTEFYFSPALAESFQLNSLITGIVAVFAVVVMIFLRYGDPRVAVPMSVTGLSEVVILLGFAAAVGLPLNLSHVAGFIVVVGTGVDDLIIIADEVMSEGEVSSHHVFDNRFRKAFWVIGAAAATTIIAMSPLAVLELGDLRGFAIITILGVVIGVTITRPAYGNILRGLKTEGR